MSLFLVLKSSSMAKVSGGQVNLLRKQCLAVTLQFLGEYSVPVLRAVKLSMWTCAWSLVVFTNFGVCSVNFVFVRRNSWSNPKNNLAWFDLQRKSRDIWWLLVTWSGTAVRCCYKLFKNHSTTCLLWTCMKGRVCSLNSSGMFYALWPFTRCLLVFYRWRAL